MLRNVKIVYRLEGFFYACPQQVVPFIYMLRFLVSLA